MVVGYHHFRKLPCGEASKRPLKNEASEVASLDALRNLGRTIWRDLGGVFRGLFGVFLENLGYKWE